MSVHWPLHPRDLSAPLVASELAVVSALAAVSAPPVVVVRDKRNSEDDAHDSQQ